MAKESLTYSDAKWRDLFVGLHDRHGREFVEEDERAVVSEGSPGWGEDVSGFSSTGRFDGRPELVVLTPIFSPSAWARFKRRVKADKAAVPASKRQRWHSMGAYTDKYPMTSATHDLYFVCVGVKHGADIHGQARGINPNTGNPRTYGADVPYSVLFGLLAGHGFDPLLPLRPPSRFREKFQTLLGDAILDGVGGRSKGLRGGLAAAKAVAQSARDFVVDYIVGGVKPSLEAKTIANREAVGIQGTTALSATGQLADAIEGWVVSLQSDRLKARRAEYAAEMRRKRAKMEAMERAKEEARKERRRRQQRKYRARKKKEALLAKRAADAKARAAKESERSMKAWEEKMAAYDREVAEIEAMDDERAMEREADRFARMMAEGRGRLET